ncbi:MAG: ankyrin repeat domain-containing protein [Rickettsiaceae bacterium]|nr:ankyrin repeat domain-containing protein [Rickettsiaceae bacterium]
MDDSPNNDAINNNALNNNDALLPLSTEDEAITQEEVVGQNNNIQQDRNKQFFEAAAAVDIQRLLALIEGADVNNQDRQGRTLLNFALYCGCTVVVEAIIRLGADVNAPDNEGNTPMHSAAGVGDATVFNALIEAGADVNAKNNDGNTPLNFLSCRNYGPLIGPDADANAQKPVHLAAVYNTLIKWGADVNAADNKGNTPLHFAVRHVNPILFKALIEEARADVNAINRHGLTAISIALEQSPEPLLDSIINGYVPESPQEFNGIEDMLAHLINADAYIPEYTEPSPHQENINRARINLIEYRTNKQHTLK